MATVAVSLVRAVVDELERRSLPATSMLVAAEIDPALLDDANARVPLPSYDRLQRGALARSGDPAFGLTMGEHASFSAFSVLGHMASQARTIGEAIELALRYYRVVADVAAAPTLIPLGDAVFFHYEYLRCDDPELDRLRAEFGLVRLLSIARLLLGEEAGPTETWFEHAAPPYAAQYERVFRGTERFGKERTGFVVPLELMARTQRHHDAALLDAMRARADRVLERLTDDSLGARVRRVLVEERGRVRPEMDDVARRLGTSARTLRRKLADEGVAFQRLVDEAMRESACSMLRDPARSIQQAAYELGFSDPSSFHRAFKRWTGTTPNAYRREQG